MILKSSQFYGVEDEHQASQWQVAINGNFQDSIVAEEWRQSENFYNEINTQLNDDLTDIEIENIEGDENYGWRVRYRDQYLKWSEWSSPSFFFLQNGGTPVSGNLILNPGAENGINNWTGDIESLENAECGSVSPNSGTHNFGVGGICSNESNFGIAEQTIDLSAYSIDIDNNLLSLEHSGFMRNYSGSDLPEMYVEFYDGTTLLGTTATLSNSLPQWLLKSSVSPIPISTNSCKVILTGTRNAGTDNDSYFDDLSVVVTERVVCLNCFGASNIDNDQDGFCSDLDCDDNNQNIFPGAVELCNSLDDNCDLLLDNGDVVVWTGDGATLDWGDGKNWSQNFVPLECQNVLIPAGNTVKITNIFPCKSIEIENGSTLTVENSGLLNINGQSSLSVPLVKVFGDLIIHGKIIVKGYLQESVNVYSAGSITNRGKIYVE